MTTRPDVAAAPTRRAAVAGSFYPADPSELARLVDDLLATAIPPAEVAAATIGGLAGILVPHAGLAYSGRVAAAAWRLAGMSWPPAAGAVPPPAGAEPPTVVLLGTNHSAGWLDGVGVWDRGAWCTPLGDVQVDEALAAAILDEGAPFVVDLDAHRSEHSLEVQLPFLRAVLPGARIVPLAVGTGSGDLAVFAGGHLGRLLADRRRSGARILLVISTDMAHYPPAVVAARVTDELAPLILGLEPARLARREANLVHARLPGVACGMCGIAPTVLGLAALRSMGVEHGTRVAWATSADVGGPADHTVGYLAAAFTD